MNLILQLQSIRSISTSLSKEVKRHERNGDSEAAALTQAEVESLVHVAKSLTELRKLKETLDWLRKV